MPHPPIMIPEVGGQELVHIEATVNAAKKVAQQLRDANPQTIVIITPHGPVFADAIGITLHPHLRGSLANFGAPEVSLGFETDGLLIRNIIKKAERLGINLVRLTDDLAKQYRFSLTLDHGALIPLYYLHKAGFKGQIVHITIGMLPYEEMYTFGKALQAAIAAGDRKVAVIASGDLSHRLIPGAPAGYSPAGAEFDRQIVAALKEVNIKAILNMDQDLVEAAGECGLRPICILMGVLGGLQTTAEVLSYEGPFGVGYAVAAFTVNSALANKTDR